MRWIYVKMWWNFVEVSSVLLKVLACPAWWSFRFFFSAKLYFCSWKYWTGSNLGPRFWIVIWLLKIFSFEKLLHLSIKSDAGTEIVDVACLYVFHAINFCDGYVIYFNGKGYITLYSELKFKGWFETSKNLGSSWDGPILYLKGQKYNLAFSIPITLSLNFCPHLICTPRPRLIK